MRRERSEAAAAAAPGEREQRRPVSVRIGHAFLLCPCDLAAPLERASSAVKRPLPLATGHAANHHDVQARPLSLLAQRRRKTRAGLL